LADYSVGLAAVANAISLLSMSSRTDLESDDKTHKIVQEILIKRRGP
jgi:hypothetical protein